MKRQAVRLPRRQDDEVVSWLDAGVIIGLSMATPVVAMWVLGLL